MEKKNQNIEYTEGVTKDGEVIESKKPQNEKPTDDIQPKIKRGRVDSLSIFEIREDELNTIEKGSTTSLYLNFSIFLLSVAVSFLIALLTSDFKDKILTFTIFCVVTTVGFIIGLVLLIMWLRQKDDFKEVIENIRQRMKE
ncbi:MAG: hypothetical protein N2044_08055 [Cyclobacteriaceae bacterium]|nr:hypothetical protein [Cyclobacteriaceae bacterium]